MPVLSLEPLRHFVQAASLAVNACGQSAPPLQLLAWQLRTLLGDASWLPAELSRPRRGGGTYLLYADPVDRFSVVSYVTEPGFRSPVHDTGVWGLYGVLRGRHRLHLHSRASDGRPGSAKEIELLHPGSVTLPDHERLPMFQIENPDDDAPGVGVHVYGGVLAGLQSHSFDEQGRPQTYVFSYANSWMPNLWTRRANDDIGESLPPVSWRRMSSV